MKKIARLYQHLTPEERFRLALEALARDDEEEMDRLGRTCPRKNYSLRDPAFTDRLDASRFIAYGFSLLWLDAWSRYLTVKAALDTYLEALSMFVRGYVQGANNAWRHAGKEGALLAVDGREPTAEELEEIATGAAWASLEEKVQEEGLREALEKPANELRALWQGFAAFWGEKGLDPEKVLTWWPPVLDRVRRERELLATPAPAEEAEAIRQTFATLWERMVNVA